MKKITLLAVLLITALSYGQELITDGGFEDVADDNATNGTTIEKPTPESDNGVWHSKAQYEGVIKGTSSDQDTGAFAIILDNTTTGNGANSNIKASQLKQNLDLVAGTTYVCSYRVKKVNDSEGDDGKLLFGYVRANAGSVHQVITEGVGSLGSISDNRWITARS